MFLHMQLPIPKYFFQFCILIENKNRDQFWHKEVFKAPHLLQIICLEEEGWQVLSSGPKREGGGREGRAAGAG